MKPYFESTIEPATAGQTKVKRANAHTQPPTNTTADSAMQMASPPTPTLSLAPLPPSSDEGRVDSLLAEADSLYKASEGTRRQLLYQRVALGRVLVELKAAVGHGKFIEAFKNWSKAGRIGFSLKTAERAMAYAEDEGKGKYVNEAKIDIVSNLADAERLRKAGSKSRKDVEAAKGQETTPKENAPPNSDEKLVSLPPSKIKSVATELVEPLLNKFNAYDAETKRELLEELIEQLTQELES